jgi:hypothetical protein
VDAVLPVDGKKTSAQTCHRVHTSAGPRADPSTWMRTHASSWIGDVAQMRFYGGQLGFRV